MTSSQASTSSATSASSSPTTGWPCRPATSPAWTPSTGATTTRTPKARSSAARPSSTSRCSTFPPRSAPRCSAAPSPSSSASTPRRSSPPSRRPAKYSPSEVTRDTLMTHAVLLPPYFAHGGGQHNRVISAMYGRLLATAVVPHRFDFSSVKESAAQADAVAQIEACAGPVLLIGYSFGAAVAAAITHPAVVGWALIAPALAVPQFVSPASPLVRRRNRRSRPIPARSWSWSRKRRLVRRRRARSAHRGVGRLRAADPSVRRSLLRRDHGRSGGRAVSWAVAQAASG